MKLPEHQSRGWRFLGLCLIAGLVIYLWIKEPREQATPADTARADATTTAVDVSSRDYDVINGLEAVYSDEMTNAARAELKAGGARADVSERFTSDPNGSIWTEGRSIAGECVASVNGVQLMSGACSGAGRDGTVFVSAQQDGCSIELTQRNDGITGKVFAYKNACGDLEEDVDLGVFEEQGACLVSETASVCLRAAVDPAS